MHYSIFYIFYRSVLTDEGALFMDLMVYYIIKTYKNKFLGYNILLSN